MSLTLIVQMKENCSSMLSGNCIPLNCCYLLLILSDSCPSASPEFEGRGAEYLNVELARFLERIMQNSQSSDLRSSLVIVPGQTCWVLCIWWVVYLEEAINDIKQDIDALVLDSGGNLLDALSLATLAALQDTKIPSIKVSSLHNNSDSTETSNNNANISHGKIVLMALCTYIYCRDRNWS